MSTPYYADDAVTLWHGDALAVLSELDAGSVDCIVTSPPYFGLRDYGVDGQLGAEASPAEYVENMRALFAEVRRVLADDGTLWLNIGDSYVGSNTVSAKRDKDASGVARMAVEKACERCGAEFTGNVGRRFCSSFCGGSDNTPRATRPGALPPKNLLGIPWRAAFALQDDGWILRNDVIWNKPNAMPESVTDRLSTRHEHMFLLTKSRTYWFDLDPIREPHVSEPGREGANNLRGQKEIRPVGPNSGAYSAGGRNPGDVWTIATQPFPGAHFATMPVALAERAIQAGCKPGGVVLDPFSGSGTTGLAAARHGRRYVGIDLNADYLDLSLKTRLGQMALIDDEGGAA